MAKYNIPAGRSEAQRQHMADLTARGVCIFCPDGIVEDVNKIEYSTSHWMVKKNSYPYDGTKLHLVLISKKHVTTISELSKAARSEFLDVVVWCEKKYKLKSYAVGFRSGDMRFNAASIEHLHAHLVVGDTDNPNHEPVRFKMSHRPD